MLQRATENPATEVLAGLVERVTFHGFCVLRVKARGQRDLITVLGHAATISAGEFVQASGAWLNDRVHGVQFRASFLKVAAPTTAEGIEKYLSSGMIRGIGPVYAKKLVGAFGEAVFEVIVAGRTCKQIRHIPCFGEMRRHTGRRSFRSNRNIIGVETRPALQSGRPT